METMSNTVCETTETLPVYVNPEQKVDLNNVRLRHIKPNSPAETPIKPAHLILSTGDFNPNETDSSLQLISQNKHNKTQISILILTVLFYILYTIRVYIPEHIQAFSGNWSVVKPKPISRVYTSDLRPDLFFENFLLHSAEICQTLWLVYILSYIVRRTHLGYLYRNPNIFNSYTCLLLISALALQAINQASLPPEVICVCLFISSILLIIICRLIALKLVKYGEKYKPIELIILRCFVLNSLFLYTTSIIYITVCTSIECLAFHFDPTNQSASLITTIGFSVISTLLLIYVCLDQFLYQTEFRSIWTPYLFLGLICQCPPLRHFWLSEISKDRNFYFHWILFITIILIIFIRISRQISIKYRERKTKNRIASFLEQEPLKS